MKTNTSRRIISYIKEKKAVTAKELVDYLGISPRAVFKQLANLFEKEILIKQGLPPKVFYSLSIKIQSSQKEQISKDLEKFVNENFLYLTPQGSILEGIDGFNVWCQKNSLPLEKTIHEYQATLAKYSQFKKNGFIDGFYKFKTTFPKVFVDEVYYLDFYSIERFGKTKLGNLLLYAKQSQSKLLTKRIAELINDKVQSLIKAKRIDVIGFIPPTVHRKIQFIKELERLLAINLPTIKIVKATSKIAIPQKTLNKLSDRIENAAKTIFVQEDKVYKNILLIDDAVGSGATFNEVAKKIKERKIIKGKIIGLALTGSFKGFDVINEV